MSAIQFLTTVAKGVRHTLFQSPEALQQVCEKIVLPNIRLRDSDEEIFEMDWVEYVRRDTEGGDADTRRRAASELVKTLTEKFPNEVRTLWPDCPACNVALYKNPQHGSPDCLGRNVMLEASV